MQNKKTFTCSNTACDVMMELSAMQAHHSPGWKHAKVTMKTNYPAHHCAWCRSTLPKFYRNTLRMFRKNIAKLPVENGNV